MKITVRTRAQNKFLCERMLRFIPSSIESIGHTGYNTWKSAVTFLHDAIDRTDDILLVVDEDAFVVDWEGVEQLCRYVKTHNYVYAGMPDGGVIDHRVHSYVHINPFFAVFNCGLIKSLKSGITRQEIDAIVFEDNMERFKPGWLTTVYNHDTEEPYAGLFYWLASKGEPLLLKAQAMRDGTSTVVRGLDEQPLCYHSWYSRVYFTDDDQKKRIDALYRKALRDRKRL
jgi:hypothetical protein